jgi:hypothetical protein
MDSYEKDKKKNSDKLNQAGKPTVNISTEHLADDFGTVSQEIDHIIGENIQPHKMDDNIQSRDNQYTNNEYIQESNDKTFKDNKQNNIHPTDTERLIKEEDDKENDEDLFEIKYDENEKNIANSHDHTTGLKKVNNSSLIDKKHHKKISFPKIKWNKNYNRQNKKIVENQEKASLPDTQKKGFLNKKHQEKIDSIKSDINDFSTNENVNPEKINKPDKKAFNIFSKKKDIQNQSESIKQEESDYLKDSEKKEETYLQNDYPDQSIQQEQASIDQDVIKLLAITDELLGKLPEDVINEFASSEDFQLYKKVMKKYQIGN